MALAMLSGAVVAAAADDPVLASFEGGVVRAGEVAREARFMRPSEARFRDAVGMGEGERTRDWIRRVALRKMAAVVAEREGWIDEPNVAARARQEARRWLLGQWRERCYGEGMPSIDEAALRAEVAEEAVALPERLRLSHFFRRADGPEALAAARAELAALRADVTEVEAFRAQAKKSSEGQTAWKGGMLGTIRKGTLPTVLWDALWPLEAGTVSEPIPGPGGVHLFFVERRLPSEKRGVDALIKKRSKALETQARNGCRAKRLTEAQTHFRAFEIDGGWTINGVRFVPGVDGTPGPEPERTWAEEEQLYQLALTTDDFGEAERARLWDLEHDMILGTLMRRRQAEEVAEPGESSLRARFAAEPERYRKRGTRSVRTMNVALPATGDPLVFLDRVATIAAAIRAGEQAWSDWETALPGARSETLPPLENRALASRLGPPVFERIKHLVPGDVSPPFQEGREVVVVSVTGETPGRAMTFEEAVGRLRQREIADRKKAVSAFTAERLLETFGFALTPEGRARTTGSLDPHDGTP